MCRLSILHFPCTCNLQRTSPCHLAEAAAAAAESTSSSSPSAAAAASSPPQPTTPQRSFSSFNFSGRKKQHKIHGKHGKQRTRTRPNNVWWGAGYHLQICPRFTVVNYVPGGESGAYPCPRGHSASERPALLGNYCQYGRYNIMYDIAGISSASAASSPLSSADPCAERISGAGTGEGEGEAPRERTKIGMRMRGKVSEWEDMRVVDEGRHDDGDGDAGTGTRWMRVKKEDGWDQRWWDGAKVVGLGFGDRGGGVVDGGDNEWAKKFWEREVSTVHPGLKRRVMRMVRKRRGLLLPLGIKVQVAGGDEEGEEERPMETETGEVEIQVPEHIRRVMTWVDRERIRRLESWTNREDLSNQKRKKLRKIDATLRTNWGGDGAVTCRR